MAQTIASAQHVLEVWELKANSLHFSSGCYGTNESMRLESATASFGKGEGLPGKVWSTRAPVLFDQFRAVDFVRIEAARSVGLTAGIGLPVMEGGQFTSALTILLHGGQAGFVCEVWTPGGGSTLKLRSGYYGKYHRFQDVSSLIKFPYGQGLPGIVWATRAPQIVENLGTSPLFLRATDAKREGLFTGLGIPVATGAGLEVVLLLSSKEDPVAKAMEIWKPDGDTMRLVQASYSGPRRLVGTDAVVDDSGQGLAAIVGRTRLPFATEELDKIEAFRNEWLDEAGLSVGVGFPVFIRGELKAVVALLN